MDGADAPCSTVFATIGAGGASPCPNNDCGIGTATPYRCVGPVCGYMHNQYLATHENEVNGLLLTNSQYAQYLQGIIEGPRLAIVDQLVQTLCAPYDMSCQQNIYAGVNPDTSIGNNCVKGGNCNFSLSVDVQAMLDLSSCIDLRCGDFGSLHFAYQGAVHLDPAQSVGLLGLGAIVHSFVDLFLGNTIWADGIPR